MSLCWCFVCRLNRLCELPRGFGSFPTLQILDLTYNNLTIQSFSANFGYLGGKIAETSHIHYCTEYYSLLPFLACLRALFLGDNDLTAFPPKMEKFVHLEVVRLWKRKLFQFVMFMIFVFRLYASMISSCWSSVSFYLWQLIIRDNDIVDVPTTIHACTKLKTLQLQGNQINILPPELGGWGQTCHMTRAHFVMLTLP